MVTGGRTPIRVLVVDDSPFSRRAITRMLQRSPLVDVIGSAGDGQEALRKVMELRPDLITLDLEMPRMDGFTFLRLVMSRLPTPVIVVSARCDDQDLFRALDFGAVDFVAKPTPRATPELEQIEQSLLRKVHAIRQLRIQKVRERLDPGPPPRGVETPLRRAPRLAVFGASTGGPSALMQVLGGFVRKPDLAVVVAQHMPAGFTQGFAERLDRLTLFEAREAETGDVPEPGLVLVAPGGRHLELESRGGRSALRVFPAGAGDRYAPSVDRLFESAAKHYGEDLLGVVLTGMGEDGRAGAIAVRSAGGAVLAESEETAVVFGMPDQAARTGCVDAVLPLWAMAGAIQDALAIEGVGT